MISSPPRRPPESPTPEGTALYACDCPGFKQNNPVKFCLRCLCVWVEGLPGMFSGKQLERQMRKAASILARLLKEDPQMGRVTLNQALQAAERRG